MSKRRVQISKHTKTVLIEDFEVSNELVFRYFSQLSAGDRNRLLDRAICIGVMALMEDRLSAFLSRTANELGTELESLKYLYDLNNVIFTKSTTKGRIAEIELAWVIESYIRERNYRDRVIAVGDCFGNLPANKTGDLLIEINGNGTQRIVLESKFDKGKRLGRIDKKRIFSRGDTAIGQLMEGVVNRAAKAAIIVFDRSTIDEGLARENGGANFYPGAGYVCIIDYLRGDYSNLFLCYELARALMLSGQAEKSHSKEALAILVGRFLHDFESFKKARADLGKIKEVVSSIEQSLENALLSIEYTKEYFARFLEAGDLTPEELLELYSAASLK